MTEEQWKELQRRLDRLETFYSKVGQTEQPCLWDGMPETSPGSGIKVGMLSCPCPKCSPRC